ncbi:hypothetical protein AMTRI_Chr08g203820 [Amborella trichopoda]
MVLEKSLDYGFKGYRVPIMPRASRSARGKASVTKKIGGCQKMFAFELLASVASQILQKNEDNVNPQEMARMNRESNGDCLKATGWGSINIDGSLAIVSQGVGGLLGEHERSRLGSCNKSFSDNCRNKLLRLDDSVGLETKCPALVSLNSSSERLSCRALHRSSSKHVKYVNRDDDEKFSGCSQSSPLNASFSRPLCFGVQRIEEMVVSKPWKFAPELLKKDEFPANDVKTKPFFRSNKACHIRRRASYHSYFKRRKLFKQSSVSKFKAISICASTFPEKCRNGEDPAYPANIHRASVGVSSPASVLNSSWKTRESHVKLSVKSFKVPELFIEMPETATVDSLKRAVMEAAMTVLGGGLRVHVLLHGNKVPDDSKTLLQSGISPGDNMDTLGFMLEPNPIGDLTLKSDDPLFMLYPAANQPFTRYHANPSMDSIDGGDHSQTESCNGLKKNHDEDDTHLSHEVPAPESSKSLIVLPNMCTEALNMVPLDQRSQKTELTRRRIRRPFSVAEVEALVQAVEQLGTGRWRDVKHCAFDCAKHRTYVDLKDKWKTLVHTAQISPQQRRGEAVPQELLDRVLAVHSYWSPQKPKDK